MRNGLKHLIFGATLIVVGTLVIPLGVLVPLIFSDVAETQFLVPGSAEFEVEEPGRFYLWNDYQTIFGGTSYNRSESLPDGLSIRIQDTAGRILEFIGDTSISSNNQSSGKVSIGYVEVIQPGLLTVSVAGDTQPRVVSFAESKLLQMFGLIFGGVFLSIRLGLIGVIVGVIGVVKIAQNPKS